MRQLEIKIGLDIGACNIKIVVLDSSSNTLCYKIFDTTNHTITNLENALKEILFEYELDSNMVKSVGVTGIGRRNVSSLFSKKVTSIPDPIAIKNSLNKCKCNDGKGKLVLDIGAEKWKFLHIKGNGTIGDFKMNDACAAGTGKFLDYLSNNLRLSLDEMTEFAFSSEKTLGIKQRCGVLVESEIISRLAAKDHITDLCASIFTNVVDSVMSPSGSINSLSKHLVLIGGVADNKYIQKLLRDIYDVVVVPESSKYFSAIGAAT